MIQGLEEKADEKEAFPVELHWEEEFEIHVRVEDGEARIAANAEGLRSLANHLLALAEEQPGTHLHLDRHNSLEENSALLLLERI